MFGDIIMGLTVLVGWTFPFLIFVNTFIFFGLLQDIHENRGVAVGKASLFALINILLFFFLFQACIA